MRKWTETVKPWPRLCSNRLYMVRVISVSKEEDGKSILLEVEFLEDQQKGRNLQDNLDLPIRQQGRTADFFRACGWEVKLQARLTPLDTVGCTISVQLEKDINDNWHITEFTPITQEQNDESNS